MKSSSIAKAQRQMPTCLAMKLIVCFLCLTEFGIQEICNQHSLSLPSSTSRYFTSLQNQIPRFWGSPVMAYKSVWIVGLRILNQNEDTVLGLKVWTMCEMWPITTMTPKYPAASEEKPLVPRVAWQCLPEKSQRKTFKIKLLEFNLLYCLFLLKTYCDCSRDGHFILTCNNGFNGKGCEATVSDRMKWEYSQ